MSSRFNSSETREPIPVTWRHAKRIDYEYERAGTASTFMFTESPAGWREATAKPTKTKLDWAIEMARLIEGRYRKCPMVTVVFDNLNTQTIGAFYEAFSPARARALVRRLHFCHTPKHGSLLNIAENELSSLTRQCVSGRWFGTLTQLQSELSVWSTDSNTRQHGVDWQMKVNDAGRKRKFLYTKIKT